MRDVVIGAYGYREMAEHSGLPRGRVVYALRKSGPVDVEALVRIITAVLKLESTTLDVKPAQPEPAAAAE